MEAGQFVDVADVLCDAMDVMYMVCKAVVAVSTPEPGLHGSSYQDVFGDDLTWPTDEKGAIVFDHIDSIRTAAMKNSTWRSRVKAYWTLGANDAAAAKDYKELVEDLGEDCDVDVVTRTLGKIKKHSSLPSGCLPNLAKPPRHVGGLQGYCTDDRQL